MCVWVCVCSFVTVCGTRIAACGWSAWRLLLVLVDVVLEEEVTLVLLAPVLERMNKHL